MDGFGQEKIFRVKDRLAFVKRIRALRPLLFDPSKIEHTRQGGWTHPWQSFDALTNYLLLTCFDKLGQGAEYLDFMSWLSAKRYQVQRDSVLASLRQDEDQLERTKKLHKAYLSEFGTKNSFYRFINEVIPESSRKELLRSVRIRRIDNERNIETEVVEADLEKTAFLFKLRNLFTHDALVPGSPAGGVFESWGKPLALHGKDLYGYETIHMELVGRERMDYSVRRWPSVLIEVVEAGIVAAEAKGCL